MTGGSVRCPVATGHRTRYYEEVPRLRTSQNDQVQVAIEELATVASGIRGLDIKHDHTDRVTVTVGKENWPAKVLALDAVSEGLAEQLVATEAQRFEDRRGQSALRRGERCPCPNEREQRNIRVELARPAGRAPAQSPDRHRRCPLRPRRTRSSLGAAQRLEPCHTSIRWAYSRPRRHQLRGGAASRPDETAFYSHCRRCRRNVAWCSWRRGEAAAECRAHPARWRTRGSRPVLGSCRSLGTDPDHAGGIRADVGSGTTLGSTNR